MSKDTIIFDLDGTLLDTLDDLKNSTNYALKLYGYPEKSREEIRSFVGNGVRNLMRLSLPAGEDNPDFKDAFSAFKKHYAVHCNDLTRPYDGILSVLKELKADHYKMAIVSNKSDSAVKALNDIYFKEYISVAIGENEEKGVRKKPYPDTVFEALKELNSGPENAVYVGDSEVDLMTAKNANLDVIICEWGFRDADFLLEKGAKNLIRVPEELKDYL